MKAWNQIFGKQELQSKELRGQKHFFPFSSLPPFSLPLGSGTTYATTCDQIETYFSECFVCRLHRKLLYFWIAIIVWLPSANGTFQMLFSKKTFSGQLPWNWGFLATMDMGKCRVPSQNSSVLISKWVLNTAFFLTCKSFSPCQLSQ